MKKRINQGQSLVEVVVALGITVLIVLALLAVVIISVRNVSYSRNQAQATKYGQEAIEKIRAYRSQVSWAIFISNCQNPPGLSTLPSSFTRAIACPGGADYRDITVTIFWTDSAGTHQSRILTRLGQLTF